MGKGTRLRRARSTGICDACGLGATVVEIDDNGVATVHSAMAGPGGSAEPFDYDKATFEIVSYTKHFTALAMVNLETKIPGFADTTIGKWLPCDWEAALYPSVANITLQELRLHTSGLPPQAPSHDLAGADGNPFAGYTEKMLCDSLLALTGPSGQGSICVLELCVYFGGDDPLASLPHKRSLRFLSDGNGANLQEMREGIYLTYAM